MSKETEEKKPKVKTLEDKGTKVDFVDFGDGRQAFIYREKTFRGVEAGGFRLGWTDTYKVISPQELTGGTVTALSKNISTVSGSPVKITDFELYVGKKKKQE